MTGAEAPVPGLETSGNWDQAPRARPSPGTDGAALSEAERLALGTAAYPENQGEFVMLSHSPIALAVESILAARHAALTARLRAAEAVALPGTLAAMRQIADDAAAVVRGLAPRE